MDPLVDVKSNFVDPKVFQSAMESWRKRTTLLSQNKDVDALKLDLTIEETSSDGLVKLKFNQPTIVPGFIKQKDDNEGRGLTSEAGLLSLNQINPADIFQFQILK